VFDGDNFRVQITIHNNFELTSNAVLVEPEFIFNALDIFFDVENEIDLSSLLSDFGMSVSDFDPLILNTE
jgi:hypothetical protein